ncbi:hypothetical protein [Flavobacterium algicola]|uniref:hypothetical protein n=1 Tax=Flavobacterium algicola TaxID=556529 RepID=UPI001EFCB53F|nr:hypothetical protein [Flavobacterium algicola]MCG9792546.1 hypothetical protein [Flavobacterium algicola]
MQNFTSLLKKVTIVCTAMLLFSCSEDEDDNVNVTYNLAGQTTETKMFIYYGPEVMLGSGTARTWVKINVEGFAKEIGIEISENAVQNPGNTMVMSTSNSAMEHGDATILPLHTKASQTTAFDHVAINWNPHGHEPVGVFDVAHFDFHFYLVSVAEQLAIPAWSDATDAMFNNYPEASYLPSDYFTPPGVDTATEQMGKHWMPVALGDYLPFSKLLVYGSYDGKVNFIEPMVTQAYLLSKINTSENYSQPVSFQKKGNYPTKYNIYHDEAKGVSMITLSDFVTRK